MMRRLIAALILAAPSPVQAQPGAAGAITIRTEQYPRPPYSGATYFIYEKDGRTICTKLAVCNKFDACETTYNKGAFKDPEDVQTGEPSLTTPAVAIPPAKLPAHVCLTKFRLR